jgi:hypothetical protein
MIHERKTMVTDTICIVIAMDMVAFRQYHGTYKLIH